MALGEDLERAAVAASAHAEPEERLVGILAAAPEPGARVYVCAFERGEERAWLALDGDGEPIEERVRVREAVSISALCEAAVDTAAGGDLEELRLQLLALRLRESPPGIEEAEEAAMALEQTIGAPPRLASPDYLDEVGAATRRLERALGQEGVSPFAEAMKLATGAVEALVEEVEDGYKRKFA